MPFVRNILINFWLYARITVGVFFGLMGFRSLGILLFGSELGLDEYTWLDVWHCARKIVWIAATVMLTLVGAVYAIRWFWGI